MRKFVLIAVGLLVVVLVGGYWYARPLLLTGTGYAAHNACALQFLADRDDPERDLPDNPLIPVLRTSVDETGATASVLGVLAGQRATYTDGLGCTLGEEDELDLPAAAEVVEGNPFRTATASVPSDEVDVALGRAFGDDLSDAAAQELGTRAVLVLQGGELVAERYGDGYDESTPQLGWSLTKSLTNLLTGRLVLADQVREDSAGLSDSWTGGDRRADITIRQLEQMTSGLRWDETYSLGTPITRMLYLEDDMADYVSRQGDEFAPGTHLEYSSGSTTFLCRALADATGRTGSAAATLMTEELFAPLGTASMLVEPDGAGTPVCSSYGWGVPRDWIAFGQLALDDGVWQGTRLLPEGWVESSTTAVELADPAENEDPGYAAGWWANERPDGTLVHEELPVDTFFGLGHDGQWLVVVPSEELVVLRMGFSPTPGDEGVPRLTADLIEAYAAD
ncbi:beta-lactamase family protein [Nocardioidaceae bacterium]|nr:beta-lactamase family protein [Nocardioidaceae bacterium]